jgi:hypothetical protein
MPRSLTALGYLLFATIAGLVWRLAPLHLPFFFYKYGGSMLWAIALYWLIAALLPKARPTTLAIIVAFAAAAIEFSRLYHTPQFDAFRETMTGKLLLGRFFSPKNIAAYWLAIVLIAAFDHATQREAPTP